MHDFLGCQTVRTRRKWSEQGMRDPAYSLAKCGVCLTAAVTDCQSVTRHYRLRWWCLWRIKLLKEVRKTGASHTCVCAFGGTQWMGESQPTTFGRKRTNCQYFYKCTVPTTCQVSKVTTLFLMYQSREPGPQTQSSWRQATQKAGQHKKTKDKTLYREDFETGTGMRRRIGKGKNSVTDGVGLY